MIRFWFLECGSGSDRRLGGSGAVFGDVPLMGEGKIGKTVSIPLEGENVIVWD